MWVSQVHSFFHAGMDVPLFVYGLFPVQGCYRQKCYKHLCKDFCLNIYFRFSGIMAQECNCWVNGWYMFRIFKKRYHTVFQSGQVPFLSPQLNGLLPPQPMMSEPASLLCRTAVVYRSIPKWGWGVKEWKHLRYWHLWSFLLFQNKQQCPFLSLLPLGLTAKQHQAKPKCQVVETKQNDFSQSQCSKLPRLSKDAYFL